MNGTHPLITDGVVNRTACASYSGSCCYWTSTIQVKACPQGYYVYKLFTTPGPVCYLSYCTETTNSSTTTGSECTNSLGSSSCSDPCVTRSVLNEPWRSVNNTVSSTLNCDYNKNGWYQFVGSGGVRIPESCVPINRCNTNYPVWMNGTHPVITDGIVNRTACASYSGSCCYWTSTIQVKACPQGYYVYKLFTTPGPFCQLSYCTDPNQCFPDEESGIVNGVSGCYCNSSLNDTTATYDAMPKDINIECGMNQITVSYSKCYIELLGFNTSSLHLKNSSCTGVIQIRDKRYITVTTLPRSGYCGTELMVTEVSNAIILFCSESNLTLGGSSSYAARMGIFQDSSYTILYEDQGGWRNTSVPLYVGISVKNETSPSAVLLMKSCLLTTTSYTDTARYNVISDYCPVLNDSTLHVEENGVSRQGRFSLNMTQFARNYSKYSIDCQIVLCNTTLGTCSPNCSQTNPTIVVSSTDIASLTLGALYTDGNILSFYKNSILLQI
ncbi:uromodulin-like [Rana temporaria]|uniref:uromodulin-like n=1 Tax=Rana temporaria TaxID=8407 RepID=UPI001AAD8D88|nr:uromodulin-like [Rana temporaria]